MSDIYIAGIAMTVFGRHLERSLEDLAGEDGISLKYERCVTEKVLPSRSGNDGGSWTAMGNALGHASMRGGLLGVRGPPDQAAPASRLRISHAFWM